jgi:cyclase
MGRQLRAIEACRARDLGAAIIPAPAHRWAVPEKGGSMAWHRREFVRASLVGAAGSVVLPGAAVGQTPAPGAPAAPPAPAVFTPLRRNVGMFHQRGGTIGWLINRDGLLVVDSQFADTAPNLLSGLKERSPRQIDVLINTHHHPDHTGGNGVLRPAAKQIVAHVRSKENQVAQAERTKTPATLPDVTFTDTWSVTMGDETLRARHWGPAHTGGDASMHFEQANVVHLGDLLNNRGFPNVDAPAGASVHGWMKVLEQMAAHYPADALYVFGHAEAGHPFIGTRGDLLYQRDYFSAVVDMAAQARKEGRSREALSKVDVLPRFEHFGGQKPRLGLALTIAYDELGKA